MVLLSAECHSNMAATETAKRSHFAQQPLFETRLIRFGRALQLVPLLEVGHLLLAFVANWVNPLKHGDLHAHDSIACQSILIYFSADVRCSCDPTIKFEWTLRSTDT